MNELDSNTPLVTGSKVQKECSESSIPIDFLMKSHKHVSETAQAFVKGKTREETHEMYRFVRIFFSYCNPYA